MSVSDGTPVNVDGNDYYTRRTPKFTYTVATSEHYAPEEMAVKNDRTLSAKAVGSIAARAQAWEKWVSDPEVGTWACLSTNCTCLVFFFFKPSFLFFAFHLNLLFVILSFSWLFFRSSFIFMCTVCTAPAVFLHTTWPGEPETQGRSLKKKKLVSKIFLLKTCW